MPASAFPRRSQIAGTVVLAALVMLAAGWVTAQADFNKLRATALSRYGSQAASFVDQWQRDIAAMQQADEQQKLQMANRFVNDRVRWVQDPEAWGQKDYWATPLETMGNGKGDCEDFAIFKYATLLLAGVEVDKLRITYVKASIGGVHAAHMVLAYYATPASEPLILDNLVTNILPASRRSDLTPVYGFNSRGLWVGGAAAPATNNPGAKLSRWRDLLQRAAGEGLG